MIKEKTLNLDLNKVGTISQNATNILKSLKGREDGIKSCVFQIDSKEYELVDGELYFEGCKVAASMRDQVCQDLVKQIGWMTYFVACGAKEDEYASGEEYDACKDLVEFCLKHIFPHSEFKLNPMQWGDSKAAWLLDNGHVIALKDEKLVKKSITNNGKQFNVAKDFDPQAVHLYIHVKGSDGTKYVIILVPSGVVKKYSFDEVFNFLGDSEQ